jgi:uncharacterized FAD-dependent dehydrogenase
MIIRGLFYGSKSIAPFVLPISIPITMFDYEFRQLKIPLDRKADYLKYLAESLRVKKEVFRQAEITRLSLDSRKKNQVCWVANIRFSVENKIHHPSVVDIELNPESETFGPSEMKGSVYVIGAGPCGLWAALSLLRAGVAVVLIEQGKPVEERNRDIRFFLKQGLLNERSNVLFGEGGAGAYSDGKLTSRNRNSFTRQVLEDLVKAGADPEVLYYTKAHIGTDKLQFILRNIRKQIVDMGGEVRFETKLNDLRTQNGSLTGILLNSEWVACENLVLASGHSARDVYRMLLAHNVKIEAKPFAIGVRVEHPQSMINRRQLGDKVDTRLTGSAEYVLKSCGVGRKEAYSFCMCPGGVLIPCATEAGTVATNGMSYSGRSAPFANSGIVVPVDYSNHPDPLAGIHQQELLEREAFNRGGKNFGAPAQTIRSFLEDRLDKTLPKSSWPGSLEPTKHSEWFASDILAALTPAFQDFERKIPGFIEQGLMVSPETRTSSPVRVLRDPLTYESVSLKGLYPLGEGAGFAGGIVSSAADGVRFSSRLLPKAGRN